MRMRRQLLEHTRDDSHGPVHQEVFFGRSVVGGIGLDFAVRKRHHLRLEALVGPYHGDFERGCLVRFLPTGPTCDVRVFRATTHAVLLGGDYTFVELHSSLVVRIPLSKGR